MERGETGRHPWMVHFLAAGVLVAVATAAFLVIWAREAFQRPGPLEAEATLVLSQGLGLDAIARRLANHGIINDPLIFKVGVRQAGTHQRLRAGEYAFPAGISAHGVMSMLVAGRTVARRLTVPEGLTSVEVIGLVTHVEGLSGPPPTPPEEGSLLPETYHFNYGDSRSGVVGRMADAMSDTLAELWLQRDDGLPYANPREALVLASIVEKETALADERGRVAAVFVNRLRRGMRLQSDSTVVYGLTLGRGPLDRPLTRADLQTPSPYNTYLIDGLPPGPIANPGRESIAAALNPIDSDELYFVADGTGGHAFARNLKDHNRNVARWRKHQREK